MRKTSRNLIFIVAALFATASGAAGQEGLQTSVTLVPGAAFDSTVTGPSLGGAVAFDLSPRFGLEASGTWVNRGTGADAVNIQAGLLANLVTNDAPVVPFVSVGAGVYRASFDLAAPRFFGALGAQYGPGMQICGGAGVCPYGDMPGFYGRRLGPVTAPQLGVPWPTRTFTDPAFHLGAGAWIHLTPHMLVRPELRGLFVVGNNHVHGLGAASVGFGFRF